MLRWDEVRDTRIEEIESKIDQFIEML